MLRRPRTRADVLRVCAWVGFPLAGMIWVGSWYRSNYPYYDEWSTIAKTLQPWTVVFDGHQGHLEIPSYVLYRLQRYVFGFEGHQIVYGAFLLSLAAMQVSIAAVLRRLGLPTLVALLAATVATFSGPGAQGMTWEFMLGINFALALTFVATFVALSGRKDIRAAAVIAFLLLVAFTADSGVASFGAVLVGLVVVFLWPWRLAALALIPALLAHAVWFAVADAGPSYAASRQVMWTFAWRLLALSAGGVVGGADIPSRIGATPTSGTLPVSGVAVGIIVLVAASACVVFGLTRRKITREVAAALAGGVASAIVIVAVLARTRAWLIPPSNFAGSRYLQWVGAFLLVAFAPAIAATVRPMRDRSRRLLVSVSSAALIAVFVINLTPLEPARAFQNGWSTGAEDDVRQTVTILVAGCGDGMRPNLEALPAGNSPQIDVRLIRDLLADGSLTSNFGIPASTENRDQVCTVRTGR